MFKPRKNESKEHLLNFLESVESSRISSSKSKFNQDSAKSMKSLFEDTDDSNIDSIDFSELQKGDKVKVVKIKDKQFFGNYIKSLNHVGEVIKIMKSKLNPQNNNAILLQFDGMNFGNSNVFQDMELTPEQMGISFREINDEIFLDKVEDE